MKERSRIAASVAQRHLQKRARGKAFSGHYDRAALGIGQAEDELRGAEGLLHYLQREHRTGLDPTWKQMTGRERQLVIKAAKGVAAARKKIQDSASTLKGLQRVFDELDKQGYYR